MLPDPLLAARAASFLGPGPAPRRRAGQVLRYPQRLLYSSSTAKIATWISRLIQRRRHFEGFAI